LLCHIVEFLDGYARQSTEAERHRRDGDDPQHPSRPGVRGEEAGRDHKRGHPAIEASAAGKSPKTVNNVLTVLNVLLQTAVEWDVLERMPCTIRHLPIPKSTAQFHDFDAYERLVQAAEQLDQQTH
jgi:hypothetical protein